MPRSIYCSHCGQIAESIDHIEQEYWCQFCRKSTWDLDHNRNLEDEPIPYDRLHYFEDEDLFPEPEETGEHYLNSLGEDE